MVQCSTAIFQMLNIIYGECNLSTEIKESEKTVYAIKHLKVTHKTAPCRTIVLKYMWSISLSSFVLYHH